MYIVEEQVHYEKSVGINRLSLYYDYWITAFARDRSVWHVPGTPYAARAENWPEDLDTETVAQLGEN